MKRYDYNNLSIEDINNIEYAVLRLKELNKAGFPDEVIKNNKYYEYICHVILHRNAIHKIEMNSIYKNYRITAYHDIDKIGLTFVLGKDIAKRIHKKWAVHHNLDWENPNNHILIEKIMDYESCHYTKLREPDTAYEYSMKTHPEKMEIIEPILIGLRVNKEVNNNPLTEEKYKEMINSISLNDIRVELMRSYNFLLSKGTLAE